MGNMLKKVITPMADGKGILGEEFLGENPQRSVLPMNCSAAAGLWYQ